MASPEKLYRSFWVEDGVLSDNVAALVAPPAAMSKNYNNSVTENAAIPAGLQLGAKVAVRNDAAAGPMTTEATIIGVEVLEHSQTFHFAVEFDDGSIAEGLREEQLIPVNLLVEDD